MEFFRRTREVMLTAFSTASSNATLPTTLHVSETALGLPAEVCGFVLPLGASMNKIGSALFEGASIAFIAQVLGIPLGGAAWAVVIAMTVLTAGVANAGLPSAGVPLMIPVLDAVGVPGEGIALIIGVDRLLDMCRTTVNVTGNMVAAACVAQSEKRADASFGLVADAGGN
jgi:DAACS family dicarboxylate/amino acid:cation (Na+ or H+) symporter